MNKFYLVFCLLSTLQPSLTFADQIYISVGEARVKKSVLALPSAKVLSGSAEEAHKMARQILNTIQHDMEFMALFRLQDPKAFIEPENAGITLESFKLTDWSSIGTEFLIKSGASVADNNVTFEMRLYDVMGGKQILGKRYSATASEITVLAHTISNEIVKALTGKPGFFLSRLAFVCNRTGTKEIYTADYDGSNPKQLTHHRTLAFSPAWSPDGKKLVYSLFTKNTQNIKNIDLYEYDFATQKSTLLSNRKGTNSGAAYSPDGKKIALTMSFLGNQEVFLLDPHTKNVTKITQSFGFDVDPAWSPDGRKIAFVSSRSNLPMVYTANVDGSNVQRLTFAGRFNATPSWSPDGKKIAFAGWNDNHFDVFLMNTDGTGLERLTKDQGSNEDTVFSPDGTFIAFSSTRTGQKNVYAISIDGQTTHRLTYGLGHCEAPKWNTER